MLTLYVIGLSSINVCVSSNIHFNFIYNICYGLNKDNEKFAVMNMSNVLIETQIYALVLTLLFNNIQS